MDNNLYKLLKCFKTKEDLKKIEEYLKTYSNVKPIIKKNFFRYLQNILDFSNMQNSTTKYALHVFADIFRLFQNTFSQVDWIYNKDSIIYVLSFFVNKLNSLLVEDYRNFSFICKQYRKVILSTINIDVITNEIFPKLINTFIKILYNPYSSNQFCEILLSTLMLFLKESYVEVLKSNDKFLYLVLMKLLICDDCNVQETIIHFIFFINPNYNTVENLKTHLTVEDLERLKLVYSKLSRETLRTESRFFLKELNRINSTFFSIICQHGILQNSSKANINLNFFFKNTTDLYNGFWVDFKLTDKSILILCDEASKIYNDNVIKVRFRIEIIQATVRYVRLMRSAQYPNLKRLEIKLKSPYGQIINSTDMKDFSYIELYFNKTDDLSILENDILPLFYGNSYINKIPIRTMQLTIQKYQKRRKSVAIISNSENCSQYTASTDPILTLKEQLKKFQPIEFKLAKENILKKPSLPDISEESTQISSNQSQPKIKKIGHSELYGHMKPVEHSNLSQSEYHDITCAQYADESFYENESDEIDYNLSRHLNEKFLVSATKINDSNVLQELVQEKVLNEASTVLNDKNRFDYSEKKNTETKSITKSDLQSPKEIRNFNYKNTENVITLQNEKSSITNKSIKSKYITQNDLQPLKKIINVNGKKTTENMIILHNEQLRINNKSIESKSIIKNDLRSLKEVINVTDNKNNTTKSTILQNEELRINNKSMESKSITKSNLQPLKEIINVTDNKNNSTTENTILQNKQLKINNKIKPPGTKLNTNVDKDVTIISNSICKMINCKITSSKILELQTSKIMSDTNISNFECNSTVKGNNHNIGNKMNLVVTDMSNYDQNNVSVNNKTNISKFTKVDFYSENKSVDALSKTKILNYNSKMQNLTDQNLVSVQEPKKCLKHKSDMVIQPFNNIRKPKRIKLVDTTDELVNSLNKTEKNITVASDIGLQENKDIPEEPVFINETIQETLVTDKKGAVDIPKGKSKKHFVCEWIEKTLPYQGLKEVVILNENEVTKSTKIKVVNASSYLLDNKKQIEISENISDLQKVETYLLNEKTNDVQNHDETDCSSVSVERFVWKIVTDHQNVETCELETCSSSPVASKQVSKYIVLNNKVEKTKIFESVLPVIEETDPLNVCVEQPSIDNIYNLPTQVLDLTDLNNQNDKEIENSNLRTRTDSFEVILNNIPNEFEEGTSPKNKETHKQVKKSKNTKRKYSKRSKKIKINKKPTINTQDTLNNYNIEEVVSPFVQNQLNEVERCNDIIVLDLFTEVNVDEIMSNDSLKRSLIQKKRKLFNQSDIDDIDTDMEIFNQDPKKTQVNKSKTFIDYDDIIKGREVKNVKRRYSETNKSYLNELYRVPRYEKDNPNCSFSYRKSLPNLVQNAQNKQIELYQVESTQAEENYRHELINSSLLHEDKKKKFISFKDYLKKIKS